MPLSRIPRNCQRLDPMQRKTVSKLSGYGLALLLASMNFAPVCLAEAQRFNAQKSSVRATDTQAPWLQSSVDLGLDYDSNIFRLANNDVADTLLGKHKRNDIVLHYGAGVSINRPISQQRVLLDLSAVRRLYGRNGFLDHNDIDARAAWQWVFGKRWHGDVHALQRQYLARFEDFDAFEAPARDVLTTNEAGFQALRTLSPRLELGFDYSHRSTRHDDVDRDTLDRDSNLFGLELFRRAAESKSYLSLRAQVRKVTRPKLKSSAITRVDNSYTEYELSTNARWDWTERSRIDASVGYATVRHDEFAEHNFSGALWSLRYLYKFSPQLDIDASAWRDIDARSSTSASFMLAQTMMLRSTWRYRDKTAFSGTLAREDRSFEGDPLSASASLPAREDIIKYAEISASYAQRSFLSYNTALRLQQSDSNRAERNYRYYVISASAALNF